MTLDTYADLFDDDLGAVVNRLHLGAATARELVADRLRTNPPSSAVVVDLQDRVLPQRSPSKID